MRTYGWAVTAVSVLLLTVGAYLGWEQNKEIRQLAERSECYAQFQDLQHADTRRMVSDVLAESARVRAQGGVPSEADRQRGTGVLEQFIATSEMHSKLAGKCK